MKVKSIETNSIEEMDSFINDYDDKEIVKATHTHHVIDNDGKAIHYATVFYMPTKDKPSEVGYKVIKG